MTKINIVIIAGLTALFISCENKKTKSAEKTGIINPTFLENIKTEKAVFSNQAQELILTGKVEYDPDKIISYVPLISGVVERTYFSLGDKVKKGQPLLGVRSVELSAMQSEKTALEADRITAERELKSALSLFDNKLISEKELFEATGKLKKTEAALDKIKTDLSLYGTNGENGIFTINAQMNGYIVHKNASSGSTVSSGSDPVFTIADLSAVWVTVNVYASNLRFVREGMNVEITTLSYPDEIFYGKIKSLPQVFDPEEKVLKARIAMNNDDLKLKPEMSVLVTLKDEAQGHAVAIPSEALIFDDNRYFVVVEKTHGNFIIKEVTLQGHSDKTSYIATGLSEGENVAVKNQLLVYFKLKEE